MLRAIGEVAGKFCRRGKELGQVVTDQVVL